MLQIYRKHWANKEQLDQLAFRLNQVDSGVSVIATDIDNVLNNLFRDHAVKLLNQQTNKQLSFYDIKTIDLAEVWGVENETILKMFDHIFSNETQIFPDRYAEEMINTLKPSLAISTRPEKYRAVTEKWLESLQPKVNIKLFLNPNEASTKRQFKSEICKENGVCIMVEDAWTEAKIMADNDILVLLVDKPWNRGYEHKNVIRIKNLSAIKILFYTQLTLF